MNEKYKHLPLRSGVGLIVLNNEKVGKINNQFYSRNYNFKILPEGLNKFFKVKYIVRKLSLIHI